MDIKFLTEECFRLLKPHITEHDHSHDIEHIRRVFNLGMRIAKAEHIQVTDYVVLVPALICHDAVIYAKDDPRNKHATDDSAKLAGELLRTIEGYPTVKIPAVQTCIRECSFSKGLEPSSWESAITQDADKLESVGVFAIMRTFNSGGEMNRPFYDPLDPLCEGELSESVGASIELFKKRLFKVSETMHTLEGKSLSQKRYTRLVSFWQGYKEELIEGGIIDKAHEPIVMNFEKVTS